MTLEYVFAPGTNNEKTLTEDRIISQNPVKTHTGKADLSAVFGVDVSELQSYAQRQDRLNINVDGTTIWTGYLLNIRHSEGEPRSTGKADGIAKRLEETRPDYANIGGKVTYSDIALENAIDDYWTRTPFDNVTVKSEPTDTVADDENVQSLSTNSDFNDAVSIPSDKPFAVQNDSLELVQSGFIHEAENPDNGSAFIINDSEFSAGEGARHEQTGDNYAYNLTPKYDIPASDVQIFIRDELLDSGTRTNGIELYFNGNLLEEIDAVNFNLGWRDLSSLYDGGDLSGGTQYAFEITSLSSGNSQNITDYRVDLVHVADAAYNYNYDNDNGGNGGFLDGPELYPDGESLTWDNVNVSYNVTAARVDSEWQDDDVGGAQQVEISNDNGSTFESFSNAEDGEVSFNNSNGRRVVQRTTHDRYGSRTTATPQQGFKGQSVESWDLFLDGNDLTIIDTLDLSRNHFQNLQTLHDFGDYQWTIEHTSDSIANMPVYSYARGDKVEPKPDGFDKQENKRVEVQAQTYYNSIYLQGAQDSNGNRPTAEQKDQTAINNDGREISPGVLRDYDITTDAGADFRARSLLNAALKRNNLRGSVTVPPTAFTHPGYSYPVDFDGDGTDENKVAEEVSLTEDPENVQVRFDFVPKIQIAEEISDLRRNARQQGDRI